jgi:hypothetical protein
MKRMKPLPRPGVYSLVYERHAPEDPVGVHCILLFYLIGSIPSSSDSVSIASDPVAKRKVFCAFLEGQRQEIP